MREAYSSVHPVSCKGKLMSTIKSMQVKMFSCLKRCDVFLHKLADLRVDFVELIRDF